MKISVIISGVLVLGMLVACSEKKQSDYGTENIYHQPEEKKEAASTPPAETPVPVKTFGFNTSDKDTFQLEDGLKMIVLEKGDGPVMKKNQTVAIHYTGYLTDGTKFDSSVDKGKPYSFVVGTGAVIDGWDMAIPQLRKGSRARLLIPSHLGYGSYGFPPLIPPDADLVFDVEVM